MYGNISSISSIDDVSVYLNDAVVNGLYRVIERIFNRL